ncbi:MAG: ATP-binding cassette domain-containing protein [Coriobacteriales bacterium]|jgi:ABC-2 type transport system ATP-binding protein|nr:ATP-binding cassette domain-containing protein [Coriobacteriales bacterium]
MEHHDTRRYPEPLAIEARGLVKDFDGFRAVDGIDFSVPTGSIYGVLGPNGSGKTTTINMLATISKPTAGCAKVFGYDTQTQAHIVRQLIGLTGQFASIDESLSAQENLMLFGRLLGLSAAEAKKRAADLLEEFALTTVAKRPIAKFSGGMRRRLDLAVSLISQPPLIFLDEPTTGLDPRTRIQMWETIERLVSKGATVLLTTQYLDEADHLADKVMVLDRGKVVADGTPDELKASVGSASVQLSLEAASDFAAAAQILERVLAVQVMTVDASTLRASTPGTHKVIDALLALGEAGIPIAEINVQKPTLDEVFFALTGKAPEGERAEGDNGDSAGGAGKPGSASGAGSWGGMGKPRTAAHAAEVSKVAHADKRVKGERS